jgi:hypothetical protein
MADAAGNLLMGGSLVPLRWIGGALAIIVIFGFVTGILYWNTNEQACTTSRFWRGEWFPIWIVGKLEVRMQPWSCPPGDSYDPKTAAPSQAIPRGIVPQGN